MEAKKYSSVPLGASFVVLSSLIYASYGIWIKLLGNFFGDFTQSVLRGGIIVLLLLPFAIWRKQLTRIYWRRDAWLFLALMISTTFISMPLFYAIKTIGVGLGLGITYAGIILGTFLFGRLLDNEKYTKDKFVSTILGILGLWLIFGPTAKTFGVLGIIAALVSGLASGLNMVVNRKIQYIPTQITILNWTSTVITNFPLIFIFKESVPIIHADLHWLYLLIFSLTALSASWLLISGLKLIEAGTAGILGLLEIVFAIIIGILFFKEHLTFITSLGMICIMASSAIPYLQHYKNQKEAID